MTKILIVGNVSETYHLGSILVRSAKEINIECLAADTNPKNYAPSMSSILGKVFFKLSGKRTLEWWSFNQQLITQIDESRPNLILVTGIFPLTYRVFEVCHSLHIPIVNYLTDYPWNPNHISSVFLKNLKEYSLIISTKKRILNELIDFGVRRVEFLPFAYDPFLHYPPTVTDELIKQRFSSDITFIGTGDQERLPYFKAIRKIDGIILKVYGSAWNKIPLQGIKAQPAIFGDDLSFATYYSKLCLGIVRKKNKDQSTSRTFEIAACGGSGIYEDTQEHREIFNGYPDYGFFTSPQDLAEKCQWLLENPLEREAMRQLGIQLVVNESNTYTTRLKTILEWALP